MKFRFIIKLEGGLGNQMFEYAHARSLQKEYGGMILLDTHDYNSKQIRNVSLQHLCIDADTKFKLSIIDKIFLYYLAIFRKIVYTVYTINPYKDYYVLTKLGLYSAFNTSSIKPFFLYNWILGGWMSQKFFKNADDEIKNEFLVKEEIPLKCKAVLDDIQNCESVCVHIRLGDYLLPQWKDKLYICTPNYYYEAINIILKKVQNPVFYIFSNTEKDFELIRQNYNFPVPVKYVNMNNTDYDDLRLMYNCKHFIMSNSTYSWWAQYLCRNDNKIVIAPHKFNNYPKWDMSDIYMDNWELIKI